MAPNLHNAHRVVRDSSCPRRSAPGGYHAKSVGDCRVRALLLKLGEEQTRLARRALDARGHTFTTRRGDDRPAPPWLDETYDLVIDHWPGADRSEFSSWAATACPGAFVLTVVDG